jgi:hypothetical protein
MLYNFRFTFIYLPIEINFVFEDFFQFQGVTIFMHVVTVMIPLCLESGRFIHYRLAGPSPEPQLAVFFRVLEGPSQLLWQCHGLSPHCTSPPYKRSLT